MPLTESDAEMSKHSVFLERLLAREIMTCLSPAHLHHIRTAFEEIEAENLVLRDVMEDVHKIHGYAETAEVLARPIPESAEALKQKWKAEHYEECAVIADRIKNEHMGGSKLAHECADYDEQKECHSYASGSALCAKEIRAAAKEE